MWRYLFAFLFLATYVPEVASWPPASDKLGRGIQLHQAKKYQEAEAVLREAVNEQPNDPKAHEALGLTLVELGRSQDALQEFQKALESGSATDKLQVGIARARINLKDSEKARAALNSARELNPQNADVYYYSGMLEAERRDYGAAAREFEKALELNPSHAYAHYHAGIVYNGLKKPDKMVQHFQAFLKLAPTAPEAKKVQSLLQSVR